MKFYLLLITVILSILSISPRIVAAQSFVKKQTLEIPLGETAVKINVYEKAGSGITFFAPHHNEQIAAASAKEAVARTGGRLVEIESFDKRGNPARRLAFKLKGKTYTVDPNRVFTRNGRRCAGLSGGSEAAVETFAGEVLAIIFARDKNDSPGKQLVVAVHNNMDVDDKNLNRSAGDLTAAAFVKNAQFRRDSHGAFEAQAAGVYLSNEEADADNFIFLSSPRYVGYFAGEGFNVVVQKPAHRLESGQCSVDDGSLSVYASQQNIEYICLEADQANGGARQRQMFDSVYRLFFQSVEDAQTAQSGSDF